MAVVGEDLVAALVPEPAAASLLPLVLGDEKPKRSLADSGALESVAAQYGLPGYALGYLDSVAFVRALADDPQGIGKALLGLLGQAPPDMTGPCNGELSALAEQIPRVVAGYTEIGRDKLSMTAAVELSPQLRAALLPVRGSLPGPGAPLADGDLLRVQAALDVGRLLAFARQQTATVAAQPYLCANLAPLNGVAIGLSGHLTGLVLPPVATQLRGLHLHVNTVRLQAGVPTEVTGTVAVRTLQPAVLLALGQGFVPELATLRVEPNGAPAPLPALPRLPMVQDAQVAMKGEVLAASVGGAQTKLLPALLKVPEPAQRPSDEVLAVGYDAARFLELTNTYATGLAARMDPAAQAQLQQGVTVNQKLQAVFGMTEYGLRITEQGLSLYQMLSLRPDAATGAATQP